MSSTDSDANPFDVPRATVAPRAQIIPAPPATLVLQRSSSPDAPRTPNIEFPPGTGWDAFFGSEKETLALRQGKDARQLLRVTSTLAGAAAQILQNQSSQSVQQQAHVVHATAQLEHFSQACLSERGQTTVSNFLNAIEVSSGRAMLDVYDSLRVASLNSINGVTAS